MLVRTILLIVLSRIAVPQPPVAKFLADSGAPAVGFALIRGGQLVEQCTLGVRVKDNTSPARLRDLWHIGSDAKAMTATMIARLVEKGALSWDTPLARLMPELASTMRPAYRGVTLKDLLAHRAGLQDLIDSDVYEAFYHDSRPLHLQRIDYVRMALSLPPAFPPGTDAKYSNRGTIIAALAAEDATGLSYEELMLREVFGPLGMRSVTFNSPRKGELAGHTDGVPQFGDHADNPRVDAPAGEIRLTLHDWARFAIDQMEGEQGRGRLLRKSTYQLLHTAQQETVFGLGWGVKSAEAGVNGRFLTHSGSNGFWFARIVLAPDTESGVLLVANQSGDRVQSAINTIEPLVVPSLIQPSTSRRRNEGRYHCA